MPTHRARHALRPRWQRTAARGGNDTFIGSEGSDRIDGGSGRDVMDFRFSEDGVSLSLLRGRGWAGDRYAGVENVAGSFTVDIIWGDHGANRLEGRHGDDSLVGNGGDDYILAAHGHDIVVYSGNRADYTVTQDGIRTEVIHKDGGWEGHDVLAHAEVLRFADGDLVL